MVRMPMKPQSTGPATKVLVLCHGNICRSPLAGAVLKEMLGEENVRDRGFSHRQGLIAAKKVRDFAETFGYDLSTHRSRTVEQEDVGWADVIVYMDDGNFHRLGLMGHVALSKARSLGKYVGLSRIQDPNYIKRGPQLDAVLEQVVNAATALAVSLKEKAPRG